MKKRDLSNVNIYIELLRIFLTASICLHHFRLYSDALPYGGGYLATDCFFMISGFFMKKWIDRQQDSSLPVKKYLVGRITRLFPEYLFSIICTFLLYRSVLHRELKGNPWRYISEALMLPFLHNSTSERIIPPDWYVGYLLLASVLVLVPVLLPKNKKRSTVIICSVLSVVCYAYIFIFHNNLCVFPNESGIISIGALLRSVAGISLGSLIYDIVECHEKAKQTTCMSFFKIVLLSVLCMVEIYFLIWYRGWNTLDYVAIAEFAVLLFLCESYNENGESKVKRVVCTVSELMYCVYLNHYLIAYLFNKYSIMRSYDWKITSIMYLFVVLVYSLFIHTMYNMVMKFVISVVSYRNNTYKI